MSHGGAVAQFYFLEKWANQFEVTFCYLKHNEGDIEGLSKLTEKLPHVRVVFPKVNDDRFELFTWLKRLVQKTKSFLKSWLRISLPEMQVDHFPYGFSFYTVNEWKLLEEVLKEQEFDIIQCEFFDTLPVVTGLPKNSLKVFVYHEIRSKKIEITEFENTNYRSYIARSYRSMEQSFLSQFDRVVVFSAEDQQYLKQMQIDSIVSPYGIPKESQMLNEVSNEFQRLLFLGAENHWANRDGLIWFIEQVYIPFMDQIQWPLWVVGHWTVEFQNRYKHIPQIRFLGYVDDLNEVYNGSVMITPIRLGSGLRTKILHAFANSVPVISTEFACEGLCDVTKKYHHIVTFSSELEFLERFLQLKSNPSTLNSLAKNALEFHREHFGDDQLIAQRLAVYR